MHKLDIKIAARTFLKEKWYNFLNITGLSLGLAAFIFVTLYVDQETSYDQWNDQIGRIFLVERELPNGPSPYTPGKLAAAIKNQCPEIEETGRINTALFQIPFYTASGKYLIKKWVGADYSIAKILGIKPKDFNLNTTSGTPTTLLSKRTADVLFPDDRTVHNKTVTMLSKSGISLMISGVAQEPLGNTNLSFDCIGFSDDITQGKDQSFTSQIYQTYVLVRPNTDIRLLAQKIDKVYREAASADTSQVAKEALRLSKATIYLDPLANLHLKPHYGSAVNDQMIKGLALLAITILIISGVNFTNLYIAQAARRAKEVGVKKVNGISRRQIIGQFLIEIFIQCCFALLISLGIVQLGLPYVNQLLASNLLFSGLNLTILGQLTLTLLVLTAIAGIYPALLMAGVSPAAVLRGSPLTNVGSLTRIRSSLILFQFTFAIGFAILLMVIHEQISFMRSENPGFTAKQVVYIDNMGIYNQPSQFETVSNQIRALPGVKNVTVASNVPGGILPATYEYILDHKAYAMQTVAVGYHYFETLTIALKEGQSFASSFAVDSASAVINETAAKAMGLKNPIGTTLKGAAGNYRIIGVAADVNEQGFESGIQPMIYVMSAAPGVTKTQIMIQTDSKAMVPLLATLQHQWRSINKLDGDNFNYHFLDELYGHLFRKQEQLQAVLSGFSTLAIFIASLGLFALAAQSIRYRMKEIAIRKVFGAKGQQLVLPLSKPFFYMVLLANGVAWPLSWLVADTWLESFAYHIEVSVFPFVIALAISLVIVSVTVCGQLIGAVGVNPVVKLKM
ncbi:ABC transporter permease [Spirosoma agri]|uniref:FtsX-like permease family protein n=1 Tax=Spirosoma agri TaxID=1987381 RepID=A0A6M0ISV8_9BACT|nr:ABC transporter permease [Spirosoma agri]NEU70765.1 FtsX-like permease family protein [Spirosoma agri]